MGLPSSFRQQVKLKTNQARAVQYFKVVFPGDWIQRLDHRAVIQGQEANTWETYMGNTCAI